MSVKSFPGGLMKAVTFSYDDAVTQDQRLIQILNKYGLKCTFNLNSARFGCAGMLIRNDVSVAHCKPRACEIKAIYEGHEIAGHTLTHPNLNALEFDEQVVREVEEDRQILSDIAGYEIVGFAYPGGTGAMNDHVADLIRSKTGVRYARTTTSTYSFDPQEDLIKFDPTVYHVEWDKMYELADRFIHMNTDKPQIFYIWGHAYEFDIDKSWERFDEFCKALSGKNDIYYGTNRQVLLGMD